MNELKVVVFHKRAGRREHHKRAGKTFDAEHQDVGIAKG